MCRFIGSDLSYTVDAAIFQSPIRKFAFDGRHLTAQPVLARWLVAEMYLMLP
ncbi:hypothetical protein D1BOALGB6SA_7458 [Olavius sp. associated proteobacterium Delta 1]|nr:hypothetical protein D1BOALGB6SA_7458 [Olavius sp. associated proteobacterium Delta 1]